MSNYDIFERERVGDELVNFNYFSCWHF